MASSFPICTAINFGGIPFLVLDQQFAHRERPLWIAGPGSVAERVNLGMEVFFPGSTRVQRSFECRFSELRDRERTALRGASVTGFEVVHASGAPAYGLRLECGGTTIAYSGDTAWTDALVDLARGADLFICEAYTLEKQIRYHLSYAALAQHRHLLECRRVVLTHLGPDILEHRSDIDVDVDLADDGLRLTF